MSENKNQNFKTLIPKIDVVFQSLFSIVLRIKIIFRPNENRRRL